MEGESTASSPLVNEEDPRVDDSMMTADDTTYADETKTLMFRNRSVMLYLNPSCVIIHDVKSMKKNVDINLADIIGCEVYESKKKDSCGIRIYAYPKESSCCSGGPQRVPRTYSIAFDGQLAAQNWAHAISCAIQGKPLSFLADGADHTVMAPPRRRFLCVGTAQKIWKDVAEPMLKLAGIDIRLLVTERQNHAYEYMTKCPLDDIDLVLTVGGDGILFEVINGLYSRDDVRNAINPIPVFPIPGGTGNGLTKSILHESEEVFSPQNATFVALKGAAVPLDLSYVETQNNKHFAFLILGWGLISDIDILSETMRWMGEPRLTVAAVYFVAARRLYPGKLSMFTGVPGVNSEGSNHRVISTGAGAMFDRASTADENSILPPLHVPIAGGEGWTIVEGDFVTVWVLQTSHCSINAHSGPGVTLDDGLFTIIVARDISRCDILQLLLGIEDGSHVKHPNVEIYKASSYRLEPRTEKGIFSLDGEVVEYGPIQASVLPSIARTISLAPYGGTIGGKKNN